MGVIVLVDSCILYPAPLRDLVMRLAIEDLFKPKWTDEIHREWMTNLLKNRPDLTEAQLQETRALMHEHIEDCLVTGYESLIDGLVLPDPNDRHVLAAAIHCEAQIILTNNLKDFPRSALDPHGLESQDLDTFLLNLLGAHRDTVLSALKKQREGLKRRPRKPHEFLDTLEKNGLGISVAELRQFADLL